MSSFLVRISVVKKRPISAFGMMSGTLRESCTAAGKISCDTSGRRLLRAEKGGIRVAIAV